MYLLNSLHTRQGEQAGLGYCLQRLLKVSSFLLLCCFTAQSTLSFAVENPSLPALGDTSSATVSLNQEYKMGRAWLRMLRNQTPEITDPLIYDYVEFLLYRLAEHSQLQDRRLELVVVKDSALNAFAVPGGVVGVNGGLFIFAQSEEEFSSVLAHELAHLSQRHYSRAVEASRHSQLPGMAALLASILVAATVGGDAGIAAISATQAALLDNQLRFSRQNEQEADRIGLLTLTNSGMNPHSMASMFERMLATQRLAGNRPPEFLLTHPVTESRIADARNRASQLAQHNDPRADNIEYQLMRNRMRVAFDKSPAHAISVFTAELDTTDPILKSTAQYGLALAYFKAGRDQEANQTLQPLLNSDSNRISYVATFAQINQRPEQQSAVEALLRKHLSFNPDNYALSIYLSDSLSLQKKYAEAQTLLQQLSKQRPNDPLVWFKLAEAYGFNNNIIGVHQASAEYSILIGDLDQALLQLDYAYQKSAKNFQLTTKLEHRKQDVKRYQRELEYF